MPRIVYGEHPKNAAEAFVTDWKGQIMITAARGALAATVLFAGLALPGAVLSRTLHGADGEGIPETKLSAPDPSWQTVRIQGVNRRNLDNMVYFTPDGRVRVQRTGHRSGTEGKWAVEGDAICLNLPVRGKECWPYTHAYHQGETAELTSSKGLTVRLTVLNQMASMAPPTSVQTATGLAQ